MVFKLFRRREKTHHALTKTRQGWGGGISAILGRGPLTDDALWEEVEESLVAADVGVKTTQELVRKVRQRVQEEGTGAAEVVELFKEEMTVLLELEDKSVWDYYDQETLPA